MGCVNCSLSSGVRTKKGDNKSRANERGNGMQNLRKKKASKSECWRGSLSGAARDSPSLEDCRMGEKGRREKERKKNALTCFRHNTTSVSSAPRSLLFPLSHLTFSGIKKTARIVCVFLLL
jgi:hypothetical protein